MSDYSNFITSSGRVLLNRVLSQERLVITKAVASSMSFDSPEQLDDIEPKNQTAQQISISANGDYSEITAVFDCSSLETGYNLNMLGIYGKIEGEEDDTLIYISIPNASVQTSISANSSITFNFKFITSVSAGNLVIQTSDSYACPISHLSDNSRHLLTQVNSDSERVMINTGTDNVFSNGQVFLFLPKVNITSAASIIVAGNSYPLVSTDINGNSISNSFIPAIPYGVMYNNGSFIYKQIDKIITVNGIVHYWNGAEWKTTEKAGEIKIFDTVEAPAGFLLCNGASVLKTDYPELFSVIGYSHGGSGNSFNLPDLRGRVVIGTSVSHALASTGGEEKHTLSSSEMPSHTHTIQHTHMFSYTNYPINAAYPAIVNATGSNPIGYSTGSTASGETAGVHNVSGSGLTGGNASHNNMQPFMTANYFISTGRSLI